MSELRDRHSQIFTVREDQMLYAIPIDHDGIEEVVYTTDEADDEILESQPYRQRIKLAGVWSHLNWEEAEQRLEQIDNESVATPPITNLL